MAQSDVWDGDETIIYGEPSMTATVGLGIHGGGEEPSELASTVGYSTHQGVHEMCSLIQELDDYACTLGGYIRADAHPTLSPTTTDFVLKTQRFSARASFNNMEQLS